RQEEQAKDSMNAARGSRKMDGERKCSQRKQCEKNDVGFRLQSSSFVVLLVFVDISKQASTSPMCCNRLDRSMCMSRLVRVLQRDYRDVNARGYSGSIRPLFAYAR